MRCLIQRVASASVKVDSLTVGEIGPGLLVFVCAMETDTEQIAVRAAGKVARLRIFRDDAGRMNRSLLDFGWIDACRQSIHPGSGHGPGETVRDFRLLRILNLGAAFTRRSSRRPAGSATTSAPVNSAPKWPWGLVNDGPVTIWLDIS